MLHIIFCSNLFFIIKKRARYRGLQKYFLLAKSLACNWVTRLHHFSQLCGLDKKTNKKKKELGIPKSIKHLNGKLKYMKNLFSKECTNCRGGVNTFSNFLKIRCPNVGGGPMCLGQVPKFYSFFCNHPLLVFYALS